MDYTTDVNKKVIKVCVFGIFANIFLFIIKFVFGSIFNSQALISDSIHSFEDMTSSIVSIFGNIFSKNKNNRKYPIGKLKIQYVFSLFIGIFILFAFFSMLFSGINNILNNNKLEFSIYLVLVCVFNIILKLILYKYSKKSYIETNNILIYSNMLDQRNDVIFSFCTLIGIIFALFGIYIVDSILSILISFFLLYTAIMIIYRSICVLIDKDIYINKNNMCKIIKDKLNYEFLDILNVYTIFTGFKYILYINILIKDMSFCKIIIYETNNLKQFVLDNFKDIDTVNVNFLI